MCPKRALNTTLDVYSVRSQQEILVKLGTGNCHVGIVIIIFTEDTCVPLVRFLGFLDQCFYRILALPSSF